MPRKSLKPLPYNNKAAYAEQDLLRSAVLLHRSGQILEAQKKYEQILSYFPASFDANHLLGVSFYQLKNYKKAIECIEQAIKINPKMASAYLNRGVALHGARRLADAVASYDTALLLQPNSADAYNNRGLIFLESRDFVSALSDFERSISLKPDYAEAYNNKGLVLKQKHNFDEAIFNFKKALEHKPQFLDAHYNLANVYLEQNKFELGIQTYEEVLKIQPEYPYLLGNIALLKANICDWRTRSRDITNLTKGIEKGQKVSLPFPLLAFTNSRTHLKSVGEIFSHDKLKSPTSLTIPKRRNSDKIVLGYFSSSFYNHPGANLSSELFELHDRAHFKVIAFSFGSPPADTMNERLRNAFDLFIDVDHRGDNEIADLAKSLGVDIAIDLRGFTTNARTGIFSLRPAPIQVNFLGYPGTMGAEFMDYIIADPVLIPSSHQKDYSEKIVYLPYSYQPNDRKKIISDKVYQKSDMGLPESSFVYCCFNNNYKITPETFQIWMRILKAVEGSVLWLLSSNSFAETNLRREAHSQGVDPGRIVFADRIKMDEHLARHRCADLFLDTLPYNAHTTASDALWAGLPVLTLLGETFSGRVGASLLQAIDLSELITTTSEQYEQIAINLARHPDKLDFFKKKLHQNRTNTPLFDTPLYRKHIEAAYTEMIEISKLGQNPRHIHVKGKHNGEP